jgi:hypothetical protein
VVAACDLTAQYQGKRCASRAARDAAPSGRQKKLAARQQQRQLLVVRRCRQGYNGPGHRNSPPCTDVRPQCRPAGPARVAAAPKEPAVSFATIELIQRVRHIVADCNDWFDTAAAWYQDRVKPKKEMLDRLFPRGKREETRPVLAINGQGLDGRREDEGDCRVHVWHVPARLLAAGGNELVFQVDHSRGGTDQLAAVEVEAAQLTGDDSARPAPRPTPGWSLAVRLGHGLRLPEDRWTVQTQGAAARVKLNLAEVPADFIVTVVAAQGVNRLLALIKLLKDVWNRVQEVRSRLLKLRETLSRADAQFQAIERDLEDLDAYLRIHRVQLEPAFEGPLEGTLDDVINGPPKVQPALMAAREPKYDPEPVRELPQARPAPPPRIEQPPRPAPRPRPRSKSGAGCLGALVALAVVVGGAAVGGYFLVANGVIDLTAAERWVSELGKNSTGTSGKQLTATEKEMVNTLEKEGVKTGDVQVSLFWKNKNDLDLHVICPSGEEIYFGHTRSKCGGELDRDMNALGSELKSNAVENVFWKTGTAPKGHYKVYVDLFSRHDATSPPATTFMVRVVIRGEARFFTGTVDSSDPTKKTVLVCEFDVT